MAPTRPSPTAHHGDGEPPLQVLAGWQCEVEPQCAALRQLVTHPSPPDADARARAAAGIVRFFDRTVPARHAVEQATLFPALIESMAGSDAVCIRELTDALSHDHRALETLWQGLRPALRELAAGRPGTLAPAAVEPLIGLCRQQAARRQQELLPMAARLLDDTAIEWLAQALRERRGAVD